MVLQPGGCGRVGRRRTYLCVEATLWGGPLRVQSPHASTSHSVDVTRRSIGPWPKTEATRGRGRPPRWPAGGARGGALGGQAARGRRRAGEAAGAGTPAAVASPGRRAATATDRGRAGAGTAHRRPGSATTGRRSPEEITGRELDRSVAGAAARACPRSSAPRVARHLAAAGLLIDSDPKTAYQHTLAARARAAGSPSCARRAARRPTPRATTPRRCRAARREADERRHRTTSPIMADCERALGRPTGRSRWRKSPAVANFSPACKAEMTIVEAGARRDLGRARRRAADARARAAALEVAASLGGAAALRLRRHAAGRRRDRRRPGVVPPHPRRSTARRSPTPPSVPQELEAQLGDA